MTAYSEARRQVLHITMAGFALLLPLLTWPQAALLAGAALVFNAVVLARVAPGIIRPTDRAGIRAGVLFYPLSVLILVLTFRHRLDLVAAAWGIMAFGDGCATLAGRSIGGPRLSWNREKTWSGLAAFIVAGSAGAAALTLAFAPGLASQAAAAAALETFHPVPIRFWAIAVAAVVAGLVETMPIRLDDNLSVPATAGAALWFLLQLNWVPPMDTLALDLMIGAGVGLPLAALAWRLNGITAGGALTGTVFAAVIYAALFLAGLVVLGLALILTLASTRVGGGRKGGHETPHERRGAGNIIANCVVGTLGAVLELFSFDWGLELAGAWFVAGIAAGASDTVASEIGKRWGGVPRSFPNWRRVEPGTPGAVSVIGTVAGGVAAAVIALPAVVMWLVPMSFVGPVVASCTCGAFVESALATRFESDRVLDNHTLNFLNTAIAATMAVWWCSRIAT